jgi:hypothetical protein
MKAQRGSRGISLLFDLGARWGWVVNATPRPLYPGMTRYPLYRMLGRPRGRSGRVLKISTPPGFDPRTVQLVASRYTVYAIPIERRGKCEGRSSCTQQAYHAAPSARSRSGPESLHCQSFIAEGRYGAAVSGSMGGYEKDDPQNDGRCVTKAAGLLYINPLKPGG